jgi:transposase-like protein
LAPYRLRNVQKALRLQGVKISHVSILNWIKKYVGLMGEYLKDVTPDIGETWRADEMYVKFKGEMRYLFSLMDDETRFWIAQEVADSKERHNPRGLFREGLRVNWGLAPKTLITDGLPSYHHAFKKELQWKITPTTKPIHIREISLEGTIHNNKMERMNGEVRDRERVMRGLKNMDTPILKGMQIYHNFIRPHESLDGATPAEKAGIVVEGQDKWRTIIQNAQHQRLNREGSKHQ